MKRLGVCLLVLCALLSSCTLQKRLYRPGFYHLASSHPQKIAARPQTKRVHTSRTVNVAQITSDPTNEPRTTAIAGPVETKRALVTHSKKPVAHPVRTKLLPIKLKKLAYASITPNRVPKAAFRTMLFSLLLFGGAYYVFLLYPELLYITVGLIIMSLVFLFVSVMSAVHARKDKINNTKGWLAMSLIVILIDILEIGAIALLLIAMF